MSGYAAYKFWQLGSFSYPFYRFVLEELCGKRPEKPSLMLDAGCGGRICSLSQVPRDMSVVGVDASRENVVKSHRKALERGQAIFDFVVASITSLPFRPETFDRTVCVDVLEHVPRNREAVKEISRTCKEGAELVGSTTNLLNPVMMFDSLAPQNITKILVGRFAGKHYERHSRFHLKKLVNVISHAGFQMCEVRLLGFPPFQPWLIMFANKKLPWYAYIWIVFNRVTEWKPLNLLKEMIVFHAVKKG